MRKKKKKKKKKNHKYHTAQKIRSSLIMDTMHDKRKHAKQTKKIIKIAN